uniref:Nudix hydrolase domain-containing protein n=2 Tax=Eucampia antarctica TaxID=49252 RepID=A0A7S2RKT8_9STRA
MKNDSGVITNHKSNFELHHVNTTEQTIVLKQWLLPDKEDKIPPLATHQVGCAGLVLSEKNEILLVKEWQGGYHNRTPSKHWKLPGGLLDAGESFGDASCREVFEETGISTKFESLLSFWHRHGLTFGKSDLYVVCLLHPTTTNNNKDSNQTIQVDPMEISDAKWMPIDEFLQTQNHPLILHVLQHAFHLTKDNITNNNSTQHNLLKKQRLQPVAPIIEGAVQWPNRHPYPTYTARPNNNNHN